METTQTASKPDTTSRDSLGKAKKHTDKMLRRIERAQKDGKTKLMLGLSAEYLKSHDARLLATLRAYRKLKPNLRPNYSELPTVARSLNPWKGTQEPVRVSYLKKPNGSRRLIQSFGVQHKALQYLVAPVLEATADLHPDQYAGEGRGLPLAVRRVRDLLLEGYLWGFETDLQNCYGSFDGKKAAGFLSIADEVARHVILSDHFNLSPGNLYDLFGPPDDNGNEMIMTADALAEARLGFPQGSATSSIAVETLLAPVLKALPTSGKAVGYADNTLTMAKTESDAVTIREALWSALKAHPAGPLWPKLISSFKPGSPLDYLGHRFRLAGNGVVIQPTPENQQDFDGTVKRQLSRLKRADGSAKVKIARDLKRYVAGWTSAFKMCGGMKELRKSILEKINSESPIGKGAAHEIAGPKVDIGKSGELIV